MKKLFTILLLLVVVLGLIQSCIEPITEEQANDELNLKSTNVKQSYIVVLKDAELETELAAVNGYEAKQEKAKQAAEKILNRTGITDGELGFVYGSAIKGFSVKIAPGQLKKLQDDPSVSYIEEDQIITLVIPDIKIAAKPGGGTQPTQTTPWGIDRVNGGESGVDKTAWIIDTGIDLTHPDLTVDQTRGKNFVSTTATPNDDNGHGTHCAGIIAAKNNTIGVVGVAAGATVIPIKVLNRQGSGSYSTIIAGVDYVAENGKTGDVANMSLGGPKYDPLNLAVQNAAKNGISFSLAAGNEGTDANTKSPASAFGSNIYTISAMDSNNKFASWSNWGSPVDFCEPGVSIYSTYKSGGYATLSGTSMAAPHMAGLLLLGAFETDGFVADDKDKLPDPIAVHPSPK